MVLAFILKSAFPGVTILQFGARNDFRHALREWNDVARWHSKKINGGRINPPTREKANLQALKFSQVLRGRKSRRLCLTCRCCGAVTVLVTLEINRTMNENPDRLVKVCSSKFQVNPRGEFRARSKVAATAAAVTLAIVLGLVDYLTGREWAISAFYLLPTCLAAWVAGRWAGFAVATLCTAAWLLSDMLGGAVYHSSLIPVWNAIMLFVFFAVVVWLLVAIRSSHQHLEQTVERRTAALRAETDERRRLERAKLQAERLAVIGSMAAKVAHEIRNPLGSISLNLDLIGEELQTLGNPNGRSADECQILLREMRSQVLRISQVLQEYLGFARMPKSERVAVPLNSLLEEKLTFMQPLLQKAHVELEKSFDPDLPPVHADPEQLWEALLNLIRNAVEA